MMSLDKWLEQSEDEYAVLSMLPCRVLSSWRVLEHAERDAEMEASHSGHAAVLRRCGKQFFISRAYSLDMAGNPVPADGSCALSIANFILRAVLSP